ncbi:MULTISPECIES: 2-oxoglutarate dehydrogenase, E2 component, dihydrolipoamide succinyltransferase [Auritidibacter]|uniref:2-oxoglutarate dehydrogenase, E2 component, dihydrolipoamide succinyltransferase n=1 Tax=Auritidibacter TaxID=1160973 RepID=UPI000D72D6A4|nr:MULTISPECIES: 2-oxoglutarate dehydrogenase, E2 component, dihydrolipoamide succinyltransferase [Auritidibacter]NIH70396.1 2-oxoglutarate dehydrogenase E2 component (dihydrolipoamide succinyltransferase) [Auritidibacter ignavus]PXA81393.1 2-oxoglutarate dehydrogenase, E2 component, dihydrolipoamide succinyltransferase [Auritidibacter sp. NML120636]RMX23634.1 2-oxoglutarate dehydrogenase, E2 component, dihydrolipoamide succinyltransferase [Auritidibacter ignavus]WGH82324.1 2-oxoglutarate dehyd
MSETVNLPELGESVTEGTVTRWLKEIGDTVEVDEPIVEVSTDKVDTEIPSPVAGTLVEILVDEDETVEVGQALAQIGDADEASGSSSNDEGAADETEEKPEDQQQEEQPEESGDDSADQQAPAASSGGSGEGEEVTLPELGESVTEGTVTRWLKDIGDTVEVDEALLEISTDKVDTEIPSPVAGTLLEIKVNEDDIAEVGDVLAIVGSGDATESPSETPSDDSSTHETADEQADEEPAPAEPQDQGEAEAKTEDTQSAEPAEQPATPASDAESDTATQSSGGYVTPLVRRLARESGVNLNDVTGTGVGGRIRRQDVLTAAEAQKYEEKQAQKSSSATTPSQAPAQSSPPEPKSSVDPSKRGSTEKASRTRQVIAQRMTDSLHTTAQLTQVHEVDLTRIVALRNAAKEQFQAQHGVKLTYLAFITLATAEALRAHPVINAEYNSESKEITYHDSEDIGIAVDTEKGLLVPVIKGAGNLNLSGIASQIAELAEKSRTGKISPDLLSGGTFSITNLGSFGALFDTPVLNAPQSAILGPGNIVKRPMIVPDAEGNDSIAIRDMMYLSLTYDHQIIDGADAGRFMTTLKNRLENAEFGAELGLN